MLGYINSFVVKILYDLTDRKKKETPNIQQKQTTINIQTLLKTIYCLENGIFPGSKYILGSLFI